MRRCRLLLNFLRLMFVAPAGAQVGEFRSLFDGETLAGWEGNEDLFRVVEGAIVAGTLDRSIEADEFLCTRDEYSDFELQLDARMTDGQIAGVQFRGQRIPNSTQVGGYQADMGFVPGEIIPMVSDLENVDADRPYPLWGSLLDEYRPDRSRYPDPAAPYWLLSVPDRELVDRVLNPGEWNHVAVRAMGPSIEIRLNGTTTVEYLEREPVRQSGLICLQVHAGPPSQAFYRNIEIRRITL